MRVDGGNKTENHRIQELSLDSTTCLGLGICMFKILLLESFNVNADVDADINIRIYIKTANISIRHGHGIPQ